MQYSEGYKKQSCVVKGLGSWECLQELIQGYVAVPHIAEIMVEQTGDLWPQCGKFSSFRVCILSAVA